MGNCGKSLVKGQPHDHTNQTSNGMLTCCPKLANRSKAPDVRLNIGWLLLVAFASTTKSGAWEFVGRNMFPSIP